MVWVKQLPEGSTNTLLIEGYTTSCSSTGSNRSSSTELERPNNEDGGMDGPAYPPGFSRFLTFPSRRGDMVNHVSNDDASVQGETEAQKQERIVRNANRAQRR